MAFLESGSTITIDAVLTRRGREIAATEGRLNVAYFVPSDDGIDYTLIDDDNEDPLELLKETPILQATPSGEGVLKYKLINLPYQSTTMPYIYIEDTTLNHKPNMEARRIAPDTLNAGGNTAIENEDYIATLYDPSIAKIISYKDKNFVIIAQDSDDILGHASDYGLTTSVTVVGKAFEVMAKTTITARHVTSIRIDGKQSGDVKYIRLNVAPNHLSFTGEKEEIEPTSTP